MKQCESTVYVLNKDADHSFSKEGHYLRLTGPEFLWKDESKKKAQVNTISQWRTTRWTINGSTPCSSTGFIRSTILPCRGGLLWSTISKKGRSRDMRYDCLLTCLVIQAVHIDIGHTLESYAFLCAYRRFIGRPGRPKEIFSDNDTNFTGGERRLQ